MLDAAGGQAIRLFAKIENLDGVEKLGELRRLVELLDIPVLFATLGASNAVWVQGRLPEDREKLLAALDEACRERSEAELRHYRTHLPHL